MTKYFFLILTVFIVSSVLAQVPPACPANVRCPPGGVWGEWSTVGDGKCELDCGGCGQIYQTRDCMSLQISGCPCSTGNASRYIPCNMKTCPYPAQKACCSPFVPMVINGVQTCGPTPKTLKEPGASCCPAGGLWSDWTGYQNQNSQWVRNRRCLTAGIGCPCTGSPTVSTATCPCPEPATAEHICMDIPNSFPSYHRGLVIDHATGYAQLQMVGHNDGDDYCNKLTCEYYRPYRYVALLIMKEVSGQCTSDYVFDCMNDENPGRWQNATFTCDTVSGNWIYDFTGKQIVAYAQGVYNTQTPDATC